MGGISCKLIPIRLEIHSILAGALLCSTLTLADRLTKEKMAVIINSLAKAFGDVLKKDFEKETAEE